MKRVWIVTINFLICFFLVSTSLISVNAANIQNSSNIDSQSLILPDWEDGDYHDYYKTYEKLVEYNDNYPNLVSIFPIGESVFGKAIWCIKLTNEQSASHKYSCLIEGCIHGCEWEAGELCLYFAEYLLINFARNNSVSEILNETEIYIVPLVNPDGRQKDERCNSNGIDLDANFDVDFGRIRGMSIPLGKIFRLIRIPYVYIPFVGMCSNSGRRPFSEPETRAIRDLIKELKIKDFSFLVDCHTAGHCVLSPWLAFKEPFEMAQRQTDVFDFSKAWIENNTEYSNYVGDAAVSGTVMDWCFKEFSVPAFTFELLNQDYEPGAGNGRHDSLVHWMKTGLPVLLYMVENTENFHNWNEPNVEPILPAGVPPDPI